MRDVYIVAVGMIPFGRHFSLNHKQMTQQAVENLFKSSEVDKTEIEAAWFSNSGWGVAPYGQICIRGQVALSGCGISGIPITNVENACASGSTAINGAYLAILSGAFDVALAAGVEKLAVPKDAPKGMKKATMDAFIGGTDVEVARAFIEAIKEEADKKPKDQKTNSSTTQRPERTPFMDLYAVAARIHMKKYGTTKRQLAVISAKNHNNGVLNPFAQYNFPMTPEQVINDYEVAYPLTRAMCSPMGDGSAAAILVSGDYLRKKGLRGVKIRTSVMGSADMSISGDQRASQLAEQAYRYAGIGPEDVDFAEVHDATAFGELVQYENLGFCRKGEGGLFAEIGATALSGRLPVNPSGGLESRGHPVGATGIAMVCECFWQLCGRAGKRQIKDARIGIVENGGGFLGTGEAAMVINILEAPQK